MSVLGPSIAAHIKASKSLYKLFKPLADRYASMAGYRQHGLKYDDLLIEENPVVQKVSYSLTFFSVEPTIVDVVVYSLNEWGKRKVKEKGTIG